MAGDAVVTKIIDFFVLLLHFGRVMLMTAIASVSVIVIIGMAKLALLVGTAVVQREGVLEASRFPCICAVTLRTLTAEMVGWPVPAVT